MQLGAVFPQVEIGTYPAVIREWAQAAEALAVDFAARGVRTEEQVRLMRRLWTEELITFEGDRNRVTHAQFATMRDGLAGPSDHIEALRRFIESAEAMRP